MGDLVHNLSRIVQGRLNSMIWTDRRIILTGAGKESGKIGFDICRDRGRIVILLPFTRQILR